MAILGERIARIKCNDDIFDVVLANKYAHCYLNNIDMISSKELDIFAPVVGMLVSSACVPDPEISVKSGPSYSDFLKGVLDIVNKSNSVKVKVLEDKPDEMDNQKPKQAVLNGAKLEEYRSNIKAVLDCVNDVVDLSDVLLKTKLPKSIHAFKDLDRTLTKTKAATAEHVKAREDYDIMVEQTGSRVGRVIIALESSNKKDPNVQKIIEAYVNNIVNDFMRAKKLLASVMGSYYQLYDINNTFKKHTGYPATWFFDPSVFYNFSERYKDASDNLIDAVRTEASVIRPLYGWFSELNGRN